MLRVSDLHQIYWEESGNPNGIPILVLHGGPGAGSRPEYRGLFNPDKFRIIMFDQRGSGKSLPSAEIRENTIDDLISDIRTLKNYLGVTERWQVFGTSWGSTLAQKYALAHQDDIGELILNGVCFGDQPGAHLLVDDGEASRKRPDAFRIYADPAFVPEAFAPDGNLIPGALPQAYYARLKGDHGPDIRIEAARRFIVWDLMLMQHPGGAPEEIENNKAVQDLIDAANANPTKNLALATLFFHYYTNEYDPDGPEEHLKAMADNITIPVHIIQGADDLITPARFAQQLHSILPQSDLTLLADQGHSKAAAGMYRAIARITDSIADRLRPALLPAFTAADPVTEMIDPAFITPANGAPGMPEV